MGKVHKAESLDNFRKQLKKHIETEYNSVEEFCYANDIGKSTISNFLNGNRDSQVSTLEKIAQAMGKTLQITIK